VITSGAFLGLIANSTYGLTNLATLRDWSVKLSIIDLASGSLVTSLAAAAGYFGARSFSGIATRIL
jgi:uncharacterized membrane protein